MADEKITKINKIKQFVCFPHIPSSALPSLSLESSNLAKIIVPQLPMSLNQVSSGGAGSIVLDAQTGRDSHSWKEEEERGGGEGGGMLTPQDVMELLYA